MPDAPAKLRLPCYEGYLIINEAALSDLPQTSACTAWSERWCSLEDGKLLVYKDRTSAMVNPDQTCETINIRNFADVQPTSSDSAHELILSTTQIEPFHSSRLFRPKSAMSLHRLQAESDVRGSNDYEPRPSISLAGRVSFQSSPFLRSVSSTIALKPEAIRTKPWTKLTSGSRKLYGKVTASNTNLHDTDSLPASLTSIPTSAPSLGDSRDSVDLTSSGAPSPRTPASSTFTDASPRITVRACSKEALLDWLEAFSRTIKMQQELESPPSPVIRQQAKGSSRPSLSNLPGFRTPVNVTDNPIFPSVQIGRTSLADEDTPKAARKRHSSSVSLSMQPAGIHQATADHITIQEPTRFPATSDSSSASLVSQFFSVSDAKRSRRDREHNRSISTASSSLSFTGIGRLSSTRRNSISNFQRLFGTDANDSSAPQKHLVVEAAVAPLQTPRELVQIDQDLQRPSQDEGDAVHAAGGLVPSSRHRRSGSVLRFGSARILAWRDTFTTTDSTRVDTPAGLGLEVEQDTSDELDSVDRSTSQLSAKALKGFPRLRSFRLLPKSKLEGDVVDVHRDDSVAIPHSSERVGSESVSPAYPTTPQQPVLAKSKGMSRTTSLLNLAKQTFGSMRDTSASRQNAQKLFVSPQEDASISADAHDSLERIQTQGCDFSYELVSPTREASPSISPVIGNSQALQSSATAVQAESVPESEAGIDSVCAAAASGTPVRIRVLRAVDDDEIPTSTPPFPIERILPPEQIINTFDQLRAADPTGRSCDWLGHIETATRRGSLDWAAAMGERRRSLRPAASQIFDSRSAGSIELTSPRLRSSMSAWDLPGVSKPERDVLRRREQEVPVARGDDLLRTPTATPRHSEDLLDSGTSLPVPRSLPAPPRASKRRARISSSKVKPSLSLTSASALLPAVDIVSHRHKPAPLGDLTNTTSKTLRYEDDVLDLEKLVLDEACVRTPSTKSPSRRLGSMARRKLSIRSTANESPSKSRAGLVG